jgi:OOP family OmpA-OmpF porin
MRSICFRAAALMAVGLAVAGCKSMGNKTVVPASVTVPAEGERVSLHEVMVVVDASGSMFPGTSFAYAKALTQSMVKAFPDGSYRAGLLSYGGEWTFEWLDYPAMPLDRAGIEGASNDLRFISGSTPLNEAVAYVGEKYFSRNTNRALIVVSDGKTPAQPLFDTAADMAYGGNLCIHTVQVGDDAAGAKLLADLASLTPCGSYRHGDAISTVEGMDAFIREVFFQDLAIIEMTGPDGAKGILGKVLFDSDKSIVKSEYNELLDRVAEIVKTTPGVFLCVQGHTDSTASNAYNQALSQRRAEAVCQALIARGVSADRVFPKAYGEETPAAPNNNREGRKQNRRVEMAVVE